jgi:mono/diheme cytochrome c family protein
MEDDMKMGVSGLAGVLLLALACCGGEAAPGRDADTGDPPGAAIERGAGGAGMVARGRYLVAHVAACAECHSPHGADGAPDPARWLSGIDCFADVAPDDPATGCISSANLTNHETGLKNRTDEQIKDMFLRGERPDGRALHPFMPYAYFGNMRDADADAIVAYLRTVPGVDHTATANQPPFLTPPRPAPRVPEAMIPMPRADYPQRDAALRGRYLAGEIGVCLDCHTPRGEKGPLFDRAFQGGMKFDRALLRLPAGYSEIIYSANLTPHETGIRDYSVEDVVRALKHGEDRNQGGQPLCPPMPAGPRRSFGGMTDADARDIGHYLLSLPPAEHAIPVDCRVPASVEAAARTATGARAAAR